MMGVLFKPGGAFPFMKSPAGELHNAHVPLDLLWGSGARELRDRLLEAASPAARFRILEKSLAAQAARPLAHHPAVAFALGEFQGVPQERNIWEVTQHLGLSPRRFIQLFASEVGLTPKVYCRLRRFQHTLHLLHRGRIDLAEAALSAGYYDQSHFIHDFQEFSGLSPTAYLRRKGGHPNHLPLPDER
jgi:AraC-like DNA-binding protein